MIFGLKLIAEGLIGIYINSIGSNWFCFNRMKGGLLLELKLELPPGRGFFIFFYPELYNTII
jgi:hypothetical protein